MATIVLIAASISVMAIAGALLVSTQAGILVAFLTKPIIDASWASSLGGVSALKAVGVLVPVLVLVRVFSSRNRPKIPLLTVWLAYVIYSACSFSLQIVFSPNSLDVNLVSFADSTFRVLNGLAGYLMIQCYFTDREHVRRLLLCLLLAGVFPLFIGVFQAASGVTWQERETVGLARNVGLYHDSFSVRAFVFQTLAAIFLYWSYFLDRGRTVKGIALLGLTAVCLLVLYKIYSKAGVFILLAWLIIWSVGARKLLPILFIVSCVLIANVLTDDLMVQEIQQLFSKEVTATEEGTEMAVQKRSLGGRWYLWDLYWERYSRSSILEQFFGSGRAVPAHNDFLARLISSGVIGVTIYVLLLWRTGVALVRNYLRKRSPLNVMGLMVFAMWIIDTIGLVPSLYTSYQWFVWGFIGLALRGVDWDERKRSAPQPAPQAPPENIGPVHKRGTGWQRRARRF